MILYDFMNRIFFLLLILFVLTFSGCTMFTGFYIVNESAQPITVEYKVKYVTPNTTPMLRYIPAKIAASDLDKSPRENWKQLTPDQYQFNQENRTIAVTVMPNEALFITELDGYDGNIKSNTTKYFYIEEINIKGTEGEIKLTGAQTLTAFSGSSGKFTLNYLANN